jgi:hypothetical protein
VVLELVSKQDLPVLLYALEVCSLNKIDFKALDYVVVDSVFLKYSILTIKKSCLNVGTFLILLLSVKS